MQIILYKYNYSIYILYIVHINYTIYSFTEIIRPVEMHFSFNSCLVYRADSQLQCVWLFYRCQPTTNVHEIYFKL